jgi:hypothetical protein
MPSPSAGGFAAGRRFYDRQQEGVGGYFIDSLFTEIDSLVLAPPKPKTRFLDLSTSKLDGERFALNIQETPSVQRPTFGAGPIRLKTLSFRCRQITLVT